MQTLTDQVIQTGRIFFILLLFGTLISFRTAEANALEKLLPGVTNPIGATLFPGYIASSGTPTISGTPTASGISGHSIYHGGSARAGKRSSSFSSITAATTTSLLESLLPAPLPVPLPAHRRAALPEPAAAEFQPGLLPADLTPPDTLVGWIMNWTAGLSGSQATYSNWSRGGSNTLSVSSNSLIEMLYQRNQFIYEFRVRSRYGQARIEEKGVRKTDDQISIRNRFLYDISGEEEVFKLFGNINFETQYTAGYDYEKGESGEDILISDFLAPAYFTQNTGLAYYPDENLSIETGMGLKQTIVVDTTLATRYGVPEGKKLKAEAGFTFGMNYENEIMENLVYVGYLETFTNLLRPVTRTDILFSNQLIGKVNSHINVTFRFDLLYDDDFSKRMQFSQVLSAGMSITIRGK